MHLLNRLATVTVLLLFLVPLGTYALVADEDKIELKQEIEGMIESVK